MRKLLFLLPLLACNHLLAQNILKSGPMNGYSEMREVAIWVQTTEPAILELIYWVDSIPEKEFKSAPVVAEVDRAHTAILKAVEVNPGTRYGYAIYANGANQTENRELYFETQPLWRWRADPPPFKMALGSCAYVNEETYDRPGKPYGGNYRIFQSIAEKKPDMMLWLGDNIYLREADWFSKTGIYHRYSHSRSLPELQELLSTGHHYAIWDDHDYGPNDANRTFPHKEITLEAFKDFWANNGYGIEGSEGITGAFQFHDIHFYLLDNRWNRTDANLVTAEEQVIGKAQMDWLIESLKYSRAPFKMVAIGGQVLNDAKVYENYANYEKERAELLSRITEEGIEGVFFLTGDRHHTELSKLNISGIDIYDLTVSPLTSGTHNPGSEVNSNMVEGTLVHEHNYAVIEFTGPFEKRLLNISIFGADGNLIWEKEIKSHYWK